MSAYLSIKDTPLADLTEQLALEYALSPAMRAVTSARVRAAGLPAATTDEVQSSVAIGVWKIFKSGKFEQLKLPLGVVLSKQLQWRLKDAQRGFLGSSTVSFEEAPAEKLGLPVGSVEADDHGLLMIKGVLVGHWEAQVFELGFIQDHSPATIALELGLTRNYVYVLRHRITNKVRKLVEAGELQIAG